jgi:hypothetical protein
MRNEEGSCSIYGSGQPSATYGVRMSKGFLVMGTITQERKSARAQERKSARAQERKSARAHKGTRNFPLFNQTASRSGASVCQTRTHDRKKV